MKNRTILIVSVTGLLVLLNSTSQAEPTKQSLFEQFQYPGPAYRGKPFWSWNGDLDEAELKRQIQVMQEMGLGGFFMHSRTGLATEYLGKEWFDLTNACAEEGQRQNMEAWLYDEDRWPSGTAGGMVTKNSDYRMRSMVLRTVLADTFAWSNDIVAAFASDLNGLAFSTCQRIDKDTPDSAYAGRIILVFTVETVEESSFYNGNTMVDTLNREATDRFIQLTHERYQQECGERFGTSIKGIFTDEPHRGSAMREDSLRDGIILSKTPWTGRLPEVFQQRFGGDIVAQLPDLFLQRNGQRVAPVKWQYMELCQELFLENWAKPLYDWCTEHRLLFTGHALHEDSLTSQTVMQGSLMRFYEYEHVPGVDVLTEGNRNYWIVKQCSSAARQLGRPWILSELYGCTGWQFDFEAHKYVGDWQALFGVNLRCHHLSWYTMAGQAKRDYPASILHQSAWYKDYVPVETYFARLGLLLQQGRPKCDLLVLNPVESLWCQIHAGWAANIVTPHDPELKELEKAHRDLFHWLTGAQIDFDYADEDLLQRLSRIEKNGEAPPIFHLGQAPYRAILVPKMTTLRGTTLAKLKQFRAAGGTVIFAGEAPAYVDAVKSDVATALARDAQTQTCDFTRESIVTTLRQHLLPQPKITDARTGEALSDIFCQMRQDGERSILVAMNMDRDKGYDNVQITLPVRGHVVEWDCFTGQRYAVNATQEKDTLQFVTDFPPIGTRAYVIEATPQDIASKPVYTETRRLTCDGPFDYSLDEGNVCVLDMARFKIAEGEWREAQEVLKVDEAVRTHYDLPQRGGTMVQPWYARKFLPKPQIVGEVAMAFDFQVETLPTTPVTLAMETPEVFTITVNDRSVNNQSYGWWIDTAIRRIAIPVSVLRMGTNTVTLTLPFAADRNIEALYLLGDFGVKVAGTEKTLIALPAQLAVGDVTDQGLPFYSGTIRYRIPFTVEPENNEHLFFVCPDYEGATVKVGGDGLPARLLPWVPYETEINAGARELTVDVVLTRRNTFGPLHLVPKRSGAYGPGHFVTSGKQWNDDYQLWEAGLLKAPTLSLRRGQTLTRMIW